MQGAPVRMMPGQPQFAPAARAPQQAPRFPAAPAPAPQASMPPPSKVRGVSADPAPTPPQRLVLPSPEELGIRAAPPATVASVDWNQVHARLDRLGVVNLQRDRLPQGGFRVVFTTAAGQRVETAAATEAAAMVQALDRAETGATARR